MINDRSLPGLPRRQKFTPVACVYECRATHTAGSKVWKAPDREIGKPGENRGKVIAHWDLQPTAAFHDRENRCSLWFRLWATDVRPILSTKRYRRHGVLRQISTEL